MHSESVYTRLVKARGETVRFPDLLSVRLYASWAVAGVVVAAGTLIVDHDLSGNSSRTLVLVAAMAALISLGLCLAQVATAEKATELPDEIHLAYRRLDPDRRETELLESAANRVDQLEAHPCWSDGALRREHVRIDLDEAIAQLAEQAMRIDAARRAYPRGEPPELEAAALNRVIDSFAGRATALEHYVTEALRLCELVSQQRDLEATASASETLEVLLRESALDDAHADQLNAITETLAERRAELQAQLDLVRASIAVLGATPNGT